MSKLMNMRKEDLVKKMKHYEGYLYSMDFRKVDVEESHLIVFETKDFKSSIRYRLLIDQKDFRVFLYGAIGGVSIKTEMAYDVFNDDCTNILNYAFFDINESLKDGLFESIAMDDIKRMKIPYRRN